MLYKSLTEQERVEKLVSDNRIVVNELEWFEKNLDLDAHYEFILEKFVLMPKFYQKLSASRPWICYWALHSLEIMGRTISDTDASKIMQLLESCKDNVVGGFGGGPHQDAHIASTYAAVSAIAIIGRYYPVAYDIIDKEKCIDFIRKCLCDDGSMKTSVDGEVDLRAIYCSTVTLKLLNSLDLNWFSKTPKYISSCQTYEGGFAAVPNAEAHAGYTFCGLASMILLGKVDSIDCRKLLRWASHRQMTLEGGFQGRTHKLVDSCYSYWVGSLFSMIISANNWLPFTEFDVIGFCRESLLLYIIGHCQYTPDDCINKVHSSKNSKLINNLNIHSEDHSENVLSDKPGGIVDKPGCLPDLYHTCYSLSGISLTQPYSISDYKTDSSDADTALPTENGKLSVGGLVKINSIKLIDVVFNLTSDVISSMIDHFSNVVS